MKKLVLSLAVVFGLSMVSCGGGDNQNKENGGTQGAPSTENVEGDNNGSSNDESTVNDSSENDETTTTTEGETTEVAVEIAEPVAAATVAQEAANS